MPSSDAAATFGSRSSKNTTSSGRASSSVRTARYAAGSGFTARSLQLKKRLVKEASQGAASIPSATSTGAFDRMARRSPRWPARRTAARVWRLGCSQPAASASVRRCQLARGRLVAEQPGPVLEGGEVGPVVGGPVEPVRGPEVTALGRPLGQRGQAGPVLLGRGLGQHLAVVAQQPGHRRTLPAPLGIVVAGGGAGGKRWRRLPHGASVTRRAAGGASRGGSPAGGCRYLVAIEVHLVDGTYELFRHFFGVPSHLNARGREVAAVRGVLASVLALVADGATHVGVATDHVIESFRNDMWPGYKTSAGVDPLLLGQFGLLEEALDAMGVTVWPMVALEADDALASAAQVAAADESASRVIICTPDKDLGQCVVGTRVVQLDRRKGLVIDESGVRAKFGVGPASIPDYLALVGDSADGFPGLPGWGAKTTAAVLARYEHLEAIPDAPRDWDVPIRNVAGLAVTLAAQRQLALLFRDLATLRTSPPVFNAVEELRWTGPGPDFVGLAEMELDSESLPERAEALAQGR